MDVVISVDQEVLYESSVYGTLGEAKKLVSFQNTASTLTRKKFPILGTILPFLFSRKTRGKNDIKLDIVFTAKVL